MKTYRLDRYDPAQGKWVTDGHTVTAYSKKQAERIGRARLGLLGGDTADIVAVPVRPLELKPNREVK